MYNDKITLGGGYASSCYWIYFIYLFLSLLIMRIIFAVVSVLLSYQLLSPR